MGPWSSWLTPFEAKRRFPHAEEIAGSNPAGPTTNNQFSLFSEALPYFLRNLVQVVSFWLFEPMVPNHGSQGFGDGVPTESGYDMNVKMHHHLASSPPVKLKDTDSIGANGFFHGSTYSLNHWSHFSQRLFGNFIDAFPMFPWNN